MSKIFSISAILLHASIPFIHAAAVPAFPEVIPGPGLPSLASLNITSAELYQQKPTLERELQKRFTNYCGGGRGDTGNVNDVIACFNYLENKGHTACSVPADKNQHTFCTAGTAKVSGLDVASHPASSYCSDVATGVQWVFNHCNNGGQVEGSAAAGGNGDLIVVVGGLK